MTVETFGPAAVQARIASIQSRFAAAPAASTVSSSSTASTSTSGAGTGSSTLTGSRAAEFAAALARLNEAMPDGSNTPVSGAPVVPVTPTTPVAGPAGPGTAAGGNPEQVVSDARN